MGDVVEVVRDSARERSHRLEALRLAEFALHRLKLFLRQLAVRDVGHRAHPAHDLAGVVAAADARKEVPAGFAADYVTHLHGSAFGRSGQHFRARGVPSRKVLRVYVAPCGELVPGDKRGVGRKPGEFERPRRGEIRVGGDVPVKVARPACSNSELVTLLGFAQCVFGAVARIDIADRAGHAPRITAGIPHTHTAEVAPAVNTVGLEQTELALVSRRFSRQVRLHRGGPPWPVLGMERQSFEPAVQWHHFGPGGQSA